MRVIHLKKHYKGVFHLAWSHQHVHHYPIQAQPVQCYLHLHALQLNCIELELMFIVCNYLYKTVAY